MSRLIQAYLRCLQRYPLRTQASTTGVLMGAGDVIAQLIIEKKDIKNWEPKRTGKFLAFGCFIGGPSLRGWYMVLEKYVKTSTLTLTTLSRVGLDQTVFAPTFLTVFIYSMTLWNTYSHETAVTRLKEDYFPVLVNNWKLWPAVQLLNFYFVPFQHRVLVVNCVALVWNTYLAWNTNRER